MAAIYTDKLAPWEEKKKYYSNISLGKSVSQQKSAIKDQIVEMISSQCESTDEMIANREIAVEAIHDLSYDIKSVGEGIYGIKGAFEWCLSDVLWQIELSGEVMRDLMVNVYAASGERSRRLRNDAEEAFGANKIEEATETFLELSNNNKFDFSTHISLGIIYLFHKIDRDNALLCFERAIYHSKALSPYYASYAMLYKALVNRDYGQINEAEELTRKAMNISPNLIEAVYQNAQYNALLGQTEKVIPLLRKVISEDINYCLKINSDEHFDGMREQVKEMFKTIRDERAKRVSENLIKLKSEVVFFDNITKEIKEIAQDVAKIFQIKMLKDKCREAEEIANGNSIFNIHIASLFLSHLTNKIQQKKFALKGKCQELKAKLENEQQGMDNILSEEQKKKGGILSFIFSLFLGQFIAGPIWLSFDSKLIFYIAEVVVVIACIFINFSNPMSSINEANKLKEKKAKLDRIIRGAKDVVD